MNLEKYQQNVYDVDHIFIKHTQIGKIYINCYYYGFWITKKELDKYYINDVPFSNYLK